MVYITLEELLLIGTFLLAFAKFIIYVSNFIIYVSNKKKITARISRVGGYLLATNLEVTATVTPFYIYIISYIFIFVNTLYRFFIY